MIWLVIGFALGLILTAALHRGLVRLSASLATIDAALAAVVTECQAIVPALDGLPALAETQELTAAVPRLVEGYVAALTPLI